MPVSSAASRYAGLSSTYSTSYGSGTSSLTRPASGSRSSYLDSGFSSSYRSSRPLPAGPGPLDSSGRKLSGYTGGSTLTGVRRNRTPNGISSGPLRADHTSSFAATSNKYHSESKSLYGTTGRPSQRSTLSNANFGGDDSSSRPASGRSRPSKSNSLVDLTADLRITSPAGRTSRGSSVHNERNYSPAGLERPDGTTRTGYTPSMTREGSPTTRRMIVAGERERTASPAKNTAALNYSSSSSNGGGNSSRAGTSSRAGNSSRAGSSKQTSGSGCSPCTSTMLRKKYSSTAGVSSRYRDGGKVGLKNLGNTCFMNSVIQCLSNTRVLLEYCLEDHYLQDINTTTSNMKGALIKAYASLMQSLWRDKMESVAPNSFKTQIQKFAPRFMGYAQQDSQEFMRYLLEGLHEDVNRVTKKPQPIILDDEQLEKKNNSGKAQDYWKAYVNRDNSQIVDIFVGQLMSELKFTPCGHNSVTFDPVWDLSLPIPKSGRNVSLDDCLRLFMKEEELEADERPMCAKCKSRRSCTKGFSIQKFPKILVIHLKRFSQERYGRKLTAVVDFPINNLDLSDYSAEVGGRRILYDLYAVSNHSGGTGSGHYTAYCKNPYSGEWYYYNDSRVSKASSNQVVSSEAYILYYEQSKRN